MDYKNYIERKAKGLAEVVKINGGYAFAIKRWDECTGEIIDPEIEAINSEMLDERKVELQKEIDSINAIREEMI